MPSIAVIINHASGASRPVDPEAIEGALRSGGFEPTVTIARDGSHIADAARRACAARADVVVAGGGDGTINCVVSAIVGKPIALGVLPLGTLNHFARDMRIPLDLEAALQVIITGCRTRIDVAEVNGRVFVNNSSIGLYPAIVRDRQTGQHQYGEPKWKAFAWACLRAARRYPFVDVQLLADGRSYARRTPFVFVGNNAYTISGLQIGERKTLSAGQLSLYVAQRTGRLGLIGFAVRALFGRLRQARDFDAMLSEEIIVHTRHKRMHVSTDGEVCVMDVPLKYRIRPGALEVIVPEPPTAATE